MNTATFTFSPAALAYDARTAYVCTCTASAPCAGCVEHNALFAALSATERAAVEAQVEAGSDDARACV